MGLWARLFSRKGPEDYEEVLSALALDIHKRQSRLAEIRLRERRATLLVTLYAIAVWGVYVALWYGGFVHIGEGRKMEGLWKVVKGAPIVVGPVLIQFTRRIVQAWYTRIGNAEESTLKQLLAQQRSKIEEIKQKTNFYTTKNLLERYDSTGPGGAPSPTPPSQPQQGGQQGLRQRQGRQSGVGVGGPQLPVTPQRGQGPRQSIGLPPVTPANGGPVPGGLAFTPSPQHPQAFLHGIPPNVPPQQLQFHPPRKQWYDKLADALLGDDEVSTGGGNNEKQKYALICGKCSAHNGLVKEELWEDMQYVCPKCGYFNPSYRSVKNAQSRRSPLVNVQDTTLSTPPSSPPAGDRIPSSSPPSRIRFSSSSPISSPSKRALDIDVSDGDVEGEGINEKSGLELEGMSE